MEVLDIFDASEIQNSVLSNKERFEILRQKSERQGNIKYTEIFEDIMDKHKAVFEAIDEL